jgi:hypothetical protein
MDRPAGTICLRIGRDLLTDILPPLSNPWTASQISGGTLTNSYGRSYVTNSYRRSYTSYESYELYDWMDRPVEILV